MNRRRSMILPLASAALAASLVGCTGQSKHNAEYVSSAELRHRGIKAASEYEMARQAFLSGNLEKAMQKIDQSLSQNPSVALSHVLRARILNELGRLGDALDSLEFAKTSDPNRADTYYYEGVIYERLQRREKALEAFTLAVQNDPTSEQYAIARTETLIDLGRYAEAESTLVESSTLFENSAAIQQTLGRLAMLLGDNENAVVRFREARLLAPDETVIVEDLIDAQIRTNRFAEAEHNISRLLTQGGFASRRDLKLLQARCLVELDRTMEARSILNDLTADRAGAGDADAWLLMGRVSIAMNDERRLRESSRRAVQLAPNSGEAQLLAAMSARIEGDMDRAGTFANRAAELSPNDATVLTMLGLIELERGNVQHAQYAFAKALKIQPDNESLVSLMATLSGMDVVATANDR